MAEKSALPTPNATKPTRMADSMPMMIVSARPTSLVPSTLTTANTSTMPPPIAFACQSGRFPPMTTPTYSAKPAAYSAVAMR